MPAGIFRRLAFGALDRVVEYIVHQRRLAGAADTGDADQAIEGNLDIEIPEVVFGGAFDAQHAGGGAGRRDKRGRGARDIDAAPTKEVVRGEGRASAGECADGALEHDLPAVLAGTR